MIELRVVILSIKSLSIESSLQPRCDGLDESHLKLLMQAPDSWAPIVAVKRGLRIIPVDGFHRIECTKRLGLKSIKAIIIDDPADGNLFKVAFDLNAAHGKALTLNDRKSYARSLILMDASLSDREIGRQTGLNHETVGALRTSDFYSNPQRSERRPGDLPADVSLFDPIRFSKATRAQKAAAGYIKRLAAALADAYSEDAASWWCDDAAELARAVSSSLKADRASDLFAQLEADAKFILEICSARHSL